MNHERPDLRVRLFAFIHILSGNLNPNPVSHSLPDVKTHDLSRLATLLIAFSALCSHGLLAETQKVELLRVPEGGVQPQIVVDHAGAAHMVFLRGDPLASDVFYATMPKGASSFSNASKVNTRPGSAVATGTIRGAQLAVGRDGVVHFVWNGSRASVGAGEAPDNLCYTRLNGKFEPQRNLMQDSKGLDGGATVAADQKGHVYLSWHGSPLDNSSGEAGRRLYMAKSSNDGQTFKTAAVIGAESGACACCGADSMVHSDGTIFLAYRTARQTVNRDATLMASRDGGNTFIPVRLQKWTVGKCPMSSFGLAESGANLFAAWETAGTVYWGSSALKNLDFGTPSAVDRGTSQKHPRLAVNTMGEVLIVWTEGTGWQKGGSLAWRVYNSEGRPRTETTRKPGIPVWSFAAAFARQDGNFAIVY